MDVHIWTVRIINFPNVIYKFMEWSLYLELTFKWRENNNDLMQS